MRTSGRPKKRRTGSRLIGRHGEGRHEDKKTGGKETGAKEDLMDQLLTTLFNIIAQVTPSLLKEPYNLYFN